MVVYENENDEVDVFDDYAKALKCYEEAKENAIEYAHDGGADPTEYIYLTKVERVASWKEDKNQPIYITDDYGDETDVESGEYYWMLEDRESGDSE